MNLRQLATRYPLALLTALLMSVASFAAQAAFKPQAPTVLITGANRGIGLELARQYAAKDWNVIATTRRPVDDKGTADLREIQKKHPNLHIERIDVTDTTMIRSVAAKYKDQPIDVLINNAANVEATFQADMDKVGASYDKIDFDEARTDFDVNALGPMRMAQAFMPNIEKSKQKKLVNVTSLVGSFGRTFPSPMGMNYGASKAALNMYMVKLNYAMKDKGVVVALAQPIMVASKPGINNPMAKSVEEEIGKLIKVIDGMTVENAGGRITNWTTGQVDPF
jgi:NAD(P)-dependent dehydrogenase (short-subunit alcohol dehydrogenase family)